jgi:hypothetical protein
MPFFWFELDDFATRQTLVDRVPMITVRYLSLDLEFDIGIRIRIRIHFQRLPTATIEFHSKQLFPVYYNFAISNYRSLL